MSTSPIALPGTSTILGTNLLVQDNPLSLASLGLDVDYAVGALADAFTPGQPLTQANWNAAVADAMGPNADPAAVAAAQQQGWSQLSAQLKTADPSGIAASGAGAGPLTLLNLPNLPNLPDPTTLLWILGICAAGIFAVGWIAEPKR